MGGGAGLRALRALQDLPGERDDNAASSRRSAFAVAGAAAAVPGAAVTSAFRCSIWRPVTLVTVLRTLAFTE
jgi:hypothetical protein